MSNLEYLQKFDQYMNNCLSGSLSLEKKIYYLNSRNRYRHILKNLPSGFDKMKVLDIGVSHFTYILKELFPQLDLTALDLARPPEELSEKGIGFLHHNLETDKELPRESFDFIIFGEVLEHLASWPTRTLKKLYDSLKTGGRLLLTTPNLLSIGNRMKMLVGKNPLEQVREDLSNPGHFREYSMDELKIYLSRCGFTVEMAEFPDYWNDPKIHMMLYRLHNAGFLKTYIFGPPFLALKLLLSWIAPKTRYAILIIAQREAPPTDDKSEG